MSDTPILISPSLLSCDYANIERDVNAIEAAGADWLHVDVMDGHFVPNLTIGPPLVKAIDGVATKPLDVHLMITNPLDFAEAYAKAGAHVLTFHWEVAPSADGAREVIAEFRKHGVSVVGVSINPDTPVEVLAPILDEVDLVLVMSVYPGFGGQSFIEDSLDKVRWLRNQGYQGHIEMDGGLNAETLPRCAEAGANALVSGSAIFKSPDWTACIADFRAKAEKATANCS